MPAKAKAQAQHPSAPTPPHFWQVTEQLATHYSPTPSTPRLPTEPLESVIRKLLAQQNAAPIARAQYEALKRTYPAWEMALPDGPDGIEDTLRTAGGGLSRVKAGYIFGVLEALSTQPDGLSLHALYTLGPAQARAQLEALPGVGHMTASLILLLDLGLIALPLDSGIVRVLRRLAWFEGVKTAKLEETLLELLGADWHRLYHFHVAYIRHARQTCSTARPKCSACVVREYCPSAALFEAQAVSGQG